MLKELKSISMQNKATKENIQNNHSDLKLLHWYENIPQTIKGLCFATLMATAATGCSTTGNLPTTTNDFETTESLAPQEISIDDISEMDGSDFYKALATMDADKLVSYEQSREYTIDDLEAPVYNIDQITEMFQDKTLFKNEDAFLLENPYEQNRLVKVVNAEKNFSFQGFGKSYDAPMHMENPQLFSMDKDKTKGGLEFGINLNSLNPDQSALSFKQMVFHELNHANLAQEIIVHAHHNNFAWSQVGFEAKKIFGIDLSEDSSFHTRKLLESHSDVSAALSVKINENLSMEEFQDFLRGEIDDQAASESLPNRENDEHKSFRAYNELLKRTETNPETFENMKIEEIPFYSISLVFDAGFYSTEGEEELRKHFEKVQNSTEQQFMRNIDREIIILGFISEGLKHELTEVEPLQKVLNDAKELVENQKLEKEISYAIESYKETGRLPIGFANDIGIDSKSDLNDLISLKDILNQDIEKNSSSALFDKVKHHYENMEKQLESKYIPEGYKDSPFYKKYRT